MSGALELAYKDREKRLAACREWRQKNKERMRELWRKANAKRAPRRKKRKAHRLIDDMDLFPHRCLWHFWANNGGCRNTAKWRNGQWRACDLHKLPTDVPILFALQKKADTAVAAGAG